MQYIWFSTIDYLIRTIFVIFRTKSSQYHFEVTDYAFKTLQWEAIKVEKKMKRMEISILPTCWMLFYLNLFLICPRTSLDSPLKRKFPFILCFFYLDGFPKWWCVRCWWRSKRWGGVPASDHPHLPAVQRGAEHGPLTQGLPPRHPVRGAPGTHCTVHSGVIRGEVT